MMSVDPNKIVGFLENVIIGSLCIDEHCTGVLYHSMLEGIIDSILL